MLSNEIVLCLLELGKWLIEIAKWTFITAIVLAILGGICLLIVSQCNSNIQVKVTREIRKFIYS